jgi:hypothetical protein
MGGVSRSRFNGFFALWEAAEVAKTAWQSNVTGLKPGANERKNRFQPF